MWHASHNSGGTIVLAAAAAAWCDQQSAAAVQSAAGALSYTAEAPSGLTLATAVTLTDPMTGCSSCCSLLTFVHAVDCLDLPCLLGSQPDLFG